MASIAASSVMSHARDSAASALSGAFMSTATTLAPIPASRATVAVPSPPPAPVITATRPSRLSGEKVWFWVIAGSVIKMSDHYAN